MVTHSTAIREGNGTPLGVCDPFNCIRRGKRYTTAGAATQTDCLRQGSTPSNRQLSTSRNIVRLAQIKMSNKGMAITKKYRWQKYVGEAMGNFQSVIQAQKDWAKFSDLHKR